jgi:hypothetical protein
MILTSGVRPNDARAAKYGSLDPSLKGPLPSSLLHFSVHKQFRSQLAKSGVAVEKVRDWNVFGCDHRAAVEFFLTSAKWQLPQWVLSVG